MMSHVKFELYSNGDTLTYFTAKNKSKPFFCIHGLKKYIDASEMVHPHLCSESLDPYLFWSLLGNFWPSGGQKHSEVGFSRVISQWKISGLFVHVLRYQFETRHTHLVDSATHWVRVSSRSGHSDLLNSQKWSQVIFLHLWLQQL